jgi:hypothetical protein
LDNGWYWENEDSHQSSKGFGMDKNGTMQLIWGNGASQDSSEGQTIDVNGAS